ncbi:hypothetical protein FACS1894202_11840 [Clostridia bacterium]|nr:hypothetical protein FACS1894202_11840 [Clostridia bacterium]
MRTIQAIFAAVGGFLGWFLGGLDGFVYALIAFTVADYITGVMCAIVRKELSSEVGARVILRFFKDVRPNRSNPRKTKFPNKKFPMNKKRNL